MAIVRAVVGRRGGRLILAGIVAVLPLSQGAAQTVERGASPQRLPRPGFDPIVHQVGPAQVELSIDAAAVYDSNVYATSSRAQDDGIAVIRPAFDALLEKGDSSLHASAFVEARQHMSVTRENAFLFGAGLDGSTRLSPSTAIDGMIRFDRAVQPRTDPEARAPITVSPRKINILAADAAFTARGGALVFRVAPGFDRIYFLDPAERDRNLRVYRGTARVTWQPAAPVAFFVEGFATRRDADLRRDFTGVDRDATTFGGLVGASREVTAKLNGRVGVGVFRSNPHDRILKAYTGFAIDGRVTWTPRPRTQLTFTGFRGDVATVRAGASGRTDTRFAASIEQEARHNILLSGEVGWRRSFFRGAGTSQDVVQGRIGAEFLATRVFSIFSDATFSRRNATIPLDEFSRAVAQVGARARF